MSYAERLYGKCPECEQYTIPAGKIVCCQNPECMAIVNTHIMIGEEEKYKVLGSFKGGVDNYFRERE